MKWMKRADGLLAGLWTSVAFGKAQAPFLRQAAAR